MTTSDRIHLFLAEGTTEYDKLVDIVGEPSNVYPSKLSPADEYVAGIDLESEATPFSKRLELYGHVPVSTFSILC